MKMKKLISTLIICITGMISYGQLQPVEVAELTIKVGSYSTEELFYGFAEGDQIIFNFEELNGKELKELEIIELPNSSKFMDYKTEKIVDKKISVYKKAIYQFKFMNSSLTGRVCKVKIQRIPKAESLISFNTDWTWKTLFDTVYITYAEDSLIGYDTLRYKETVKELVNTEIKEDKIISETKIPISSIGWMDQNINTKVVPITLPSYPVSDYETSNVISWAYWINVGDESIEKFNSAKTIMKGGASIVLSPLGAYAFGVVTDLVAPSGSEVVFSALTDEQNKNLFLNKINFQTYYNAKSNASFKKFADPLMCNGTYYLCLRNDNSTFKIYVNALVVAIVETKKFEDRIYDRMKIDPKYVMLNKKRMVVNSSQIRVNAD
jgi:hypothetical protein